MPEKKIVVSFEIDAIVAHLEMRKNDLIELQLDETAWNALNEIERLRVIFENNPSLNDSFVQLALIFHNIAEKIDELDYDKENVE